MEGQYCPLPPRCQGAARRDPRLGCDLGDHPRDRLPIATSANAPSICSDISVVIDVWMAAEGGWHSTIAVAGTPVAEHQ
jgi:hypothetical protein